MYRIALGYDDEAKAVVVSIFKGKDIGIPEAIADFIAGRVAGSVGRSHYLGKLSLAKKHYPKWLEFLRMGKVSHR